MDCTCSYAEYITHTILSVNLSMLTLAISGFMYIGISSMANKSKSKSVNSQSVSQPLPNPVALQFSQNENIDDAFIKLSAAVTDIIQHTNFNRLQRACIEKARSPKMLNKSDQIIPVIKEADSFEKLCSMLADTSYWNFLDIRMMEAMATASMIPAAQETIDNFKKTFFSMTLKEAAPYFPVVKVKPNHTELREELDRDPSQMTIGELHQHRFYLETKLLKTGADSCTICKIIIGSVGIIWQIHVDHAYQVYCRLKEFYYLLPLQAIRFMSVPEMEKWEELPFLWHGQDIGEVGPIELSRYVRHDPYPLPQGFEWSFLHPNDINDVIQLYRNNYPSIPIPRNFLKHFISSPLYRKGCLLGIRLSSSKKLVWLITATPYNIRVGGKLLSMVSLQQTIGPDARKQQNQLYNAGIKETMRLLGFEGIFQAAIFTKQIVIPKSVISYDVYVWDSNRKSLPYTSPRTAGLRRMKESDVPKALALTNQYTSQFKIGQVFQSEEEFTHWFLCPLQDDVITYVVENPINGNITDMFSFRLGRFNPAAGILNNAVTVSVIALIITETPAKQLITDLLVCTRQKNFATIVTLPRFGLKEHLFVDFFKPSAIAGQGHCLFYNYKYPEVDNDNHCLFGHIN